MLRSELFPTSMNQVQSVPENDSSQDSFPQELIKFSEKVEAEKLQQLAQNKSLKKRFFGDGYYASPIIALNNRDLQALTDFFHRSDMEEIDQDLTKLLKVLLPHSYFQHSSNQGGTSADHNFDFLDEFL